MNKYVKQKIENKVIVDEITGEITDLCINRKIDLDEFIMVFMNGIPEMRKLKSTEFNTLMEIWKFSSYVRHHTENGNEFINDSAFKSFCHKDGFNANDKNINTYIGNLCKKNMIIKVNRGRYILNPEYFFKGSLNNRMNAMINIQYVDGYKVTMIDPIECEFKEATK